MQDIIERLESKLAYLEQANHELSDVVYRQQQDIEAIQLRLQMFSNRMDELANPQRSWTAEEEKPPHY
jgi:SlyX protein